MDECAREATLEAMQQNNIRPFDNARDEFEFDTISILPPKKKKKKSKKRKKKNAEEAPSDVAEEEPQWLTFDTKKEAISAGWKVRLFYCRGLSFYFFSVYTHLILKRKLPTHMTSFLTARSIV